MVRKYYFLVSNTYFLYGKMKIGIKDNFNEKIDLTEVGTITFSYKAVLPIPRLFKYIHFLIVFTLVLIALQFSYC